MGWNGPTRQSGAGRGEVVVGEPKKVERPHQHDVAQL
jgi:hypothetical protein